MVGRCSCAGTLWVRNLVLCLGSMAASAVGAEALITLHFYERPPYMVARQDYAVGLTATLAGNALGLAGVEFQWKLTPAKRQLKLLERGEGLDCGVGWYKSRERERFGQFTLPIYRDRPTLALARQGYVPPLSGRLADVLADPAARVLVKDGLTYGRDVEALLSGPEVRARVQKSTAEQVTLLHMVAADRADLMLSPAEEASLLMGQLRPEEQALKRIEFSDVGEGQTRHILCSRRVDKATMDLINAALVVLTQPR